MAQTRGFVIIFPTKTANLMGRFPFSDTPIASSNIRSTQPCLRSLGYLALCGFQDTAVQVCHKDVADGQSQHLAGNDGTHISYRPYHLYLYLYVYLYLHLYIYIYTCVHRHKHIIASVCIISLYVYKIIINPPMAVEWHVFRVLQTKI